MGPLEVALKFLQKRGRVARTSGISAVVIKAVPCIHRGYVALSCVVGVAYCSYTRWFHCEAMERAQTDALLNKKPPGTYGIPNCCCSDKCRWRAAVIVVGGGVLTFIGGLGAFVSSRVNNNNNWTGISMMALGLLMFIVGLPFLIVACCGCTCCDGPTRDD